MYVFSRSMIIPILVIVVPLQADLFVFIIYNAHQSKAKTTDISFLEVFAELAEA